MERPLDHHDADRPPVQTDAMQSIDPSAQEQIDEALTILRASKDGWVALGISERLAILDEIVVDMTAVGERWVAFGLAEKGFDSGGLAEGEEWLFFATVVRAVRLLRDSLAGIQRHGLPRIPGPISQLPDGQVVAQVVPRDRWDRVLFRGITGEVRMEPGVTRDEVAQTQAAFYRGERRAGKVALVLGAGNASMLPVVDLLHKLFVEGQVVLLKPNPVNEYLGPLIEEGLTALTRRGFLCIVYGGVPEGDYLCRHPDVDELHLTGSARTFEAIIFGTGEEARQRKLARAPLTSKRFTCELGNVSPVIIVPGPWRASDIQEQAEQIATWLVANAGFGCLTPRVLIQHRGWPLRDAMLSAIGRALAGTPTRAAYYPGAREIHEAFTAAHPEARQYGDPGDDHLPWTLVTGVDPREPNDICFRREAFCGLMAETALEATDAVDFIERAVEFANTTLWGSLNATLIVHPASMKEPRTAAALERAIFELRYGAVLVNMAAFAAYYFQVTPWGGYPGHDILDIQSGIGKTANMLMFERPQKSVIRGPFRKRFDPIRVTSRRAHTFGRQLARFEASPSLGLAAKTTWTALHT